MKFSIVIPVAPERNAEIVECLKKMNYPESEFEIIVIKGTNPSENRNKGADKSKGEIIGFLDDDAFIEPDFLIRVENFFDSYKEIDIVGGPQLTPKEQEGFAKKSGYALTSKFGAAGLSTRYKKGELNLDADETSITSANLFVKKKVMKKIRFDTKLFPGEDPKFIEDARKEKMKVAYSPDFVIYHKRRENLSGLIKQISNYGKVRPEKETFRETLKKPFFLVPSLFVIYLVLSLASIILNIYPKIITLPLVFYLGLDFLFSLFESLRNRNLTAFLSLLLIFPVIHISYGVGMIFGYMKSKQ